MEITKYLLPEKEVHMVGQYVAVCWNRRTRSEVIEDPVTDVTMTTETRYRDGKPYIDFMDIRLDRVSGELYEDEDSPVQGGLSAEFAEEIARDLVRAVEYLRSVS
jgi:hypothetical protein